MCGILYILVIVTLCYIVQCMDFNIKVSWAIYTGQFYSLKAASSDVINSSANSLDAAFIRLKQTS